LLKDEKGEMLVSQKWDVDLTPHGGRALWAYLSHPLAAGSHELRLVIRDRRTGESWVGRSRLDVPAPVDADIQLGSPLLFEDGPSAHFLRLPTGKRKASKGIPVAAAPSLQGLYRLIPKDGIPVVGELSAEARRVIAVIPLEIRPFPADDKPILSVEATLRSLLDGSEIPLEVEIREYVTHDGGPDILAADLILGNIPPGRYELEITVEDMGTDRRASCRKTLIRR
jgi:hypothetical protein